MRPTTTTSNATDATASRDFHVVNIGDPAAQAPRQRSASAERSESWMTKVTSAMSHKIFSGRRLSASRSTQVMPMLNANELRKDGSDLETDTNNATYPVRNRGQALRHASSEVALLRPTKLLVHADEGVVFPTVVCDVEPNECLSEGGTAAAPTTTNRVNTIHCRTPPQSRLAVEKEHPRSGYTDDGDDDDLLSRTARNRTMQFLDDDDHDSTSREGGGGGAPMVPSATPILKDFFSRNAKTTQRERAQQRESRRESHYKTSKQRHTRLRDQVEKDQQDQEQQIQKTKIEQIRKRNLQRRLQLRQVASRLKKYVEATQESDQSRFASEREKWEYDFEVEMQTLGDAFRKVHSNKDKERPMTVAGLTVPEALTQIQREASNHDRRINTAAPAGWSHESGLFALLKAKPTMDSSSQQVVEDSQEVDNGFASDAEIDEFSFTAEGWTIQDLLIERAAMAKRITQLEDQILESKQAVVVQDGVNPKVEMDVEQIQGGFFI